MTTVHEMNPSARTRVRLLQEIPPFRPVAMQLLKLVERPEVPLDRIVELLRTDTLLASELLGLANSPLLDCPNEIKTVLHALAILGLSRVNALILTTAMRSLVQGRRSVLAPLCWRHSLATALLCERLSGVVEAPKEQCYTAGLVHEIGLLALMRAFPEYERSMTEAASMGLDVLRMERRMFYMDHCEAGRWLLGEWGCPIELQTVAAMHEDPPDYEMQDGRLALLVYMASRMADTMDMPAFPGTEKEELEEIVSVFPGRPQEKILEEYPEIAESVAAKVNCMELSLC